jgi:hypothetical protein
LSRDKRSSTEDQSPFGPQGSDPSMPGDELAPRAERRPRTGPRPTPVAPDKARAILASLAMAKRKAETESELASEAGSETASETVSEHVEEAESETVSGHGAEAEPRTAARKATAKRKSKQKTKSKSKSKRRLPIFARALLAGLVVGALAGGAYSVVKMSHRNPKTAAVVGSTAKAVAPPSATSSFQAPGTAPSPTFTPTATPSVAASAKSAASPAVAEPPPAGAWLLAADSVDSFGLANGTAAHVSFAAGAAVFTGANNSDITTAAPVLKTGPGDSFTVSVWADLTAMPTSATKAATAVSQSAGIDSAFYLQYFAPDNRWAFARLDADTASSKVARVTSLTAARTNAWTHLVGVYNAPDGAVSLYVDGVAQGTTTDKTPFASTGGLEIGGARVGNAASDAFGGQLRDVRVYGAALNPQQIAALD